MSSQKYDQKTKDDIAGLREAGMTYLAIAEKTSVPVKTVEWICLAAGADSPNAPPRFNQGRMTIVRGGCLIRRFTEEEDRRLLGLESEGMSFGGMARALGRPKSSIRNRLMTLARREARQEAG